MICSLVNIPRLKYYGTLQILYSTPKLLSISIAFKSPHLLLELPPISLPAVTVILCHTFSTQSRFTGPITSMVSTVTTLSLCHHWFHPYKLAPALEPMSGLSCSSCGLGLSLSITSQERWPKVVPLPSVPACHHSMALIGSDSVCEGS